MSDLYRIDWKKLTEGLDDKELLFIEGCVREATIDRQTIANIIDDFVDRLDHDEAPDSQAFARLVNATADRVIAAVKGET